MPRDLMFQRLLEGARKDVDRRNAAGFGRHDKWRFEINEDGGSAFEVARSGESSAPAPSSRSNLTVRVSISSVTASTYS